MSANLLSINKEYGVFLENLKQQVYQHRYQAVRQVNRELIFLYHHIGTEILRQQNQQGWGTKVIDQLSKDLRSEFPEMKGFGPQNLKYMKKFAEEYTVDEISQQLVDQLAWSHIFMLICEVKIGKQSVCPQKIVA